MEKPKISDKLTNFMFDTRDLVIANFIKDGVRPPTLFTDDGKVHRFVCEDSVKLVEKAREFISSLSKDVQMYVITYEGYATVDGVKYDALMLEVGERGGGEGAVFGQRYQPKKFLKKFKLIGNTGYFGANKNLFEN